MTPTTWKLVIRPGSAYSGSDQQVVEIQGANGEVVCNDESYYPHPVEESDMRAIVEAINYYNRK